MEPVASTGMELGLAVALLAAGVVAVPIFRRLGLGSVLGYLAAGLAVGPFGLRLFTDPEAILHVAEFGVVMFLFLIGLEMRPAKLWAMRRRNLRSGRRPGCRLRRAADRRRPRRRPAAGRSPSSAAMGFVLSSTAVIMKMLDDRGESDLACRPAIVAILLLEDLAIIPLLALVAVLGSLNGAERRSPAVTADLADPGLARCRGGGGVRCRQVAAQSVVQHCSRDPARAR